MAVVLFSLSFMGPGGIFSEALHSLFGAVSTPYYRLSVAFIIDGEEQVASSVLRERLVRATPNQSFSDRLAEGEAVSMIFPKLGRIFVLPGQLYANNRTLTYFGNACGIILNDFMTPNRGERFSSAIQEFRGTCDIVPEQLPAILRFTDPDDYQSVESIGIDDIESLTDGRVSYSRAWIETTNDRPEYIITEYIQRAYDGVRIASGARLPTIHLHNLGQDRPVGAGHFTTVRIYR